MSFERILLVGFMGAGKTSVGRLLAERLGWRFQDFDDVVEERAGRSVAEIFEQDGEDRFRVLEAEVADELLRGHEVVLGSGGGWAAVPGRIEAVPAGTAVVWLRVDAREAVRRASEQPGRRPLLAGPDAVERARILLSGRAAVYRSAPFGVDTDGRSVEDVTARILEVLAESGTPDEPE